ncbi:MAG: hypothetical protein EOO88_58775 [Pedobacter sp.]|nr:MAG: hypothetical protein EOO88_58775 [Pedobacter sp.]
MKAKETEGKQSQNQRELRRQPERRDVYSEWNNSIDSFFRDVSPFGRHRYSIFDDFHPRFNSMERYAEEMRADMDKHFKAMEEGKETEYPTLADPENTSYFMRVETNDNGHVKVKTVQKSPGNAWETKYQSVPTV